MGDAIVPILRDDYTVMLCELGLLISQRAGDDLRKEEVYKMRVLVASEEKYRIYRDSIARAIRNARPRIEVAVCERQMLEAEVARFDPHLLICNTSSPVELVEDRLGWVELSPHAEGTWKICVGGRCWESLNPSLKELLWVVDETEKLAAIKRFVQ